MGLYNDALVFDTWTPIAFKRALGDASRRGRAWLAPTWVGDHARRLQAYTILEGYVDNSARYFLEDVDDDALAAHREYGDAALLVKQIRAACIGEDQEIMVEGMDDEDDAFVDWLTEWAKKERFKQKMLETEDNAVKLGDGVYVLGWSTKHKRAKLRVYDPGFYFPVFDEEVAHDEFPDKVHIAWELPDQADGKVRIRRITWELVPLESPRSVSYADEPTEVTCLLSDGVWELDAGDTNNDVESLSADSGVYFTNDDGEELRDLDLQIDFIPVVHVPNTVAIQEHFGKSSLAHVLQILDDLANADTDLSAAAGTTGTPPIALSGTSMDDDQLKYAPGTVFQIGDGRMDVLDTSTALDALLKYIDALLDRMSSNSRIPQALLGRVKPSDVPSGVALALSFGPLKSMIDEMRLVRDDKYSLLFKFIWRMARAGGVETPEYFDATLRFGSYLPQDEEAAVSSVVRLIDKNAISLETGVAMLMQAGLPIAAVEEEIARIQSRDFERANRAFDATGDQAYVDSYLGKSGSPDTSTQDPQERETGQSGSQTAGDAVS